MSDHQTFISPMRSPDNMRSGTRKAALSSTDEIARNRRSQRNHFSGERQIDVGVWPGLGYNPDPIATERGRIKMKVTIRALMTFVICLITIPAVLAKKPGTRPAASVAGIYENFTVGKGSGDLEGMRVVLVAAGGGHYAIVQIAQGGAEDPKPEFVPVNVKGRSVDFTVGDQKFTGSVTAAGLRLKDSSGQTQLLKRKPCSSYL
jgi:hypothetical protein